MNWRILLITLILTGCTRVHRYSLHQGLWPGETALGNVTHDHADISIENFGPAELLVEITSRAGTESHCLQPGDRLVRGDLEDANILLLNDTKHYIWIDASMRHWGHVVISFADPASPTEHRQQSEFTLLPGHSAFLEVVGNDAITALSGHSGLTVTGLSIDGTKLGDRMAIYDGHISVYGPARLELKNELEYIARYHPRVRVQTRKADETRIRIE